MNNRLEYQLIEGNGPVKPLCFVENISSDELKLRKECHEFVYNGYQYEKVPQKGTDGKLVNSSVAVIQVKRKSRRKSYYPQRTTSLILEIIDGEDDMKPVLERKTCLSVKEIFLLVSSRYIPVQGREFEKYRLVYNQQDGKISLCGWFTGEHY